MIENEEIILKRKNKFKNEEEIKNYVTKNRYFSTWNENVKKEYQKNCFKKVVEGGEEFYTLKCHPKFELNTFKNSSKFDFWDQFGLVDTERLVFLYSERKDEFGKNYSEKMFSLFNSKKKSISMVPFSTHVIPYEYPEYISELVLRLVNESNSKL